MDRSRTAVSKKRSILRGKARRNKNIVNMLQSTLTDLEVSAKAGIGKIRVATYRKAVGVATN